MKMIVLTISTQLSEWNVNEKGCWRHRQHEKGQVVNWSIGLVQVIVSKFSSVTDQLWDDQFLFPNHHQKDLESWLPFSRWWFKRMEFNGENKQKMCLLLSMTLSITFLWIPSFSMSSTSKKVVVTNDLLAHHSFPSLTFPFTTIHKLLLLTNYTITAHWFTCYDHGYEKNREWISNKIWSANYFLCLFMTFKEW